jgi:hypothetical protein
MTETKVAETVQTTAPVSAWSDRHARETSMWMGGSLAETRNGYFPNIKLNNYLFSNGL